MQIRNPAVGLRVSPSASAATISASDLETRGSFTGDHLGVTLFDTADIYAEWAAPRP
jgi:hypothetical protein